MKKNEKMKNKIDDLKFWCSPKGILCISMLIIYRIGNGPNASIN